MDDVGNDATWFLVNTTTNDTVFSEQTIAVKNEQIIGDWGLSVMIQNGINPGDEGLDPNSSNGLLSVTQNKEAETVWLDYVRDTDDFFELGETNFIFTSNWIRSGSDPIDHQTLDDGEAYESILNGSWAPYRLVGTDGQGGDFAHSPAWDSFQSLSALKDVPSVDIVFTDDESLWTRVPVIETGSGSDRLSLKSNPSVNKQGEEDGSGTTGFSWFPGYALDLERGVRLNIMFGESSDHPEDNGDNMMWDPTSTIAEGNAFAAITEDPDDEYDVVFGGRHYVYIMKSVYAGSDATAHPKYDNLINMSSASNKRKVFQDAGWVSIPLLSQNAQLSDGDVEVKIRVSKTYDEYNMNESNCEADASTSNNGNPYFTFNTNDIQTVTNDMETAQDAMDLIRVVPNPYYGSNNYERDQIDQRVRITNLPKICTISIYNVSGTLVRQVKLDSDQNVTGWDWDLKNNYNVAISSGVYIIHVDAGEIGEKVLKWFGALRPIDLDSF